MQAYCPHCKTGYPLPPTAKAGTTVYCRACRKPFVLSDATVPGLRKRSLPLYNLVTLIILGAIGYGIWYYYPRLVGKPQGEVLKYEKHTAVDKAWAEATVRNNGRPGIVIVSPSLILTGNRTKPLAGLGSRSVYLKRGEITKLQFDWGLAPGEAKDVVDVKFKVSGR